MLLFSYILLVTAVLSVVGIFISIKYLQSDKARNISIIIGVLSLLLYAVLLSFSDIAKPMSVIDVQDEYITDDSGRITIEGKYKHVPDYKRLSITVTEDNKKLPEERAVITISPSTESFRIAYAMPENTSTAELEVVFDGESTKYTKMIKVVRETKNSNSSSSEEVSKSNSTASTSSKSEEKTVASSSNTTSTDSSVTSYETFNTIKSDTIERFNLEVEPKKADKLKTIEVDLKGEWIVAKISNSVNDYTKGQKEEIQKELGKRLLGLYRGAVMNGEDNRDLPIKVIYENGTVFAESTKDDPMELKPK